MIFLRPRAAGPSFELRARGRKGERAASPGRSTLCVRNLDWRVRLEAEGMGAGVAATSTLRLPRAEHAIGPAICLHDVAGGSSSTDVVPHVDVPRRRDLRPKTNEQILIDREGRAPRSDEGVGMSATESPSLFDAPTEVKMPDKTATEAFGPRPKT